jgi:3',5'-cyclic-AMP phosphodiesterase
MRPGVVAIAWRGMVERFEALAGRVKAGLSKAIFMVTFAGCSLFEYHPYEVRVPEDERHLNAKAIDHILSQPQKDTLTFILIGDTQRFYDEVDAFVRSANKQAADFVLLAGDITDFGINDEYHWVHASMKELNKPYVAVIGNHDLSGNGELVFKERYGALNTSFTVSGFKFILLNTNSREYQFNGHVPDLGWLNQELTGSGFNRAIVVSHVPPFDHDFDPQLEEAYVSALAHSGKINLSLHAHQHAYHNSEYYDDGIRYVISTSMNERMYVVIRVWSDQYTVQEVYY